MAVALSDLPSLILKGPNTQFWAAELPQLPAWLVPPNGFWITFSGKGGKEKENFNFQMLSGCLSGLRMVGSHISV